ANYIAKWNGNSWTNLGPGAPNTMLALAVSGSDVYVGGSFSITAEGSNINCVAKWDGSSWTYVGSGMRDAINVGVWALAVSGTNLYAAGSFTKADGLVVNSIAKWNGTSWSPLGSGLTVGASEGTVNSLAVSGGNLY